MGDFLLGVLHMMFSTLAIHSLYDIRDALTMEETFILTGIFILVLGVGLGFLGEWIFRKENEANDESEKQEEKSKE
jgi:hypothetical protein